MLTPFLRTNRLVLAFEQPSADVIATEPASTMNEVVWPNDSSNDGWSSSAGAVTDWSRVSWNDGTSEKWAGWAAASEPVEWASSSSSQPSDPNARSSMSSGWATTGWGTTDWGAAATASGSP